MSAFNKNIYRNYFLLLYKIVRKSFETQSVVVEPTKFLKLSRMLEVTDGRRERTFEYDTRSYVMLSIHTRKMSQILQKKMENFPATGIALLLCDADFIQ